jgi:dihydrofolate synthase/folylpolyglutamate synthase
MGDGANGFAEVLAELGERWPDAKVVPVLDRESMLVDLLGSPQDNYPVIHVAGTNGKSSTTCMVDALLASFGLRVGRFTSPDFRLADRIVRYGSALDEETFVATYREVLPYVELVDRHSPVPLTSFEVLTAMAYSAFADAPVDVAVVEAGMGGSWDSTNVAYGQVAVLTPIALDHQAYLGDTVTDIATSKAGIIKPGATVVCAAQPDEALRAVRERCDEVGATLVREGDAFGVRQRAIAVGGQVLAIQGLNGRYDDVFVPLHGAHQAQNAAVALAAVEAFFGAGQLASDLVQRGFAAVSCPGRLERVRVRPTILLDVAHNPHGMAATVAALTEDFSLRAIVGVVSVFVDKDAFGILTALEPVLGAVVITRNSSPRAMPARELAAVAVDVFGPGRVHVAGDVSGAVDAAVELSRSGVDGDGDLGEAGVLVTGSTVTVADARRLLVP